MRREAGNENGTKAPKKKASVGGAKFAGDEPKMVALDKLSPNDWNPNQMTPEERKALRATLLEFGWSRAQALLVWATDERGKRMDVIVDGEHRWEEARRAGFKEGPVVELHRISRKDAMAWTLRIDKIRGRFEDRKLARLLDEEFGVFGDDAETGAIALRLGFSPDDVDALRLKLPEIAGAGAQAPEEFPEVDPDAMTFEHECPRCKFKF